MKTLSLTNALVMLTMTLFGSLLSAQVITPPEPATLPRPLELPVEKSLIDDTRGEEKKWTSLFNGTDLSDWVQKNGTAKFEVFEGTIKGTTAVGSPNSFLCTTRDYANFELVFEVKVDAKLNSGVQIRSLSKPDFDNGRVHGPQVEIESDPGAAGYIYSEGTDRGWISPHQPTKGVFKNSEWNQYRVLAQGKRIQTWINGTAIEDLETTDVESQTGFIGLQVHGISENEGPYSVQWRDLKIRETVTEPKVDLPRVYSDSNSTDN